MARAGVDRLSTVRMAWRVAGDADQGQPSAPWGRSASRPSTIAPRYIESFVEGCRRISSEDAAQDLLPSRLARANVRLPTSDVLRQRMQTAASRLASAQAVSPSEAQRTGLLARVASWVGLVPVKTAGPREGLLEGLIRTGVPLREELLETVEQFHAQLNALRLASDLNGRARQGAALLTQLQSIGELLKAAQRLGQSGHGYSAGLDPHLLDELAQQVVSTQIAVAQVVALPVEHASFVKGVQRNWQQALSLAEVSDV